MVHRAPIAGRLAAGKDQRPGVWGAKRRIAAITGAELRPVR